MFCLHPAHTELKKNPPTCYTDTTIEHPTTHPHTTHKGKYNAMTQGQPPTFTTHKSGTHVIATEILVVGRGPVTSMRVEIIMVDVAPLIRRVRVYAERAQVVLESGLSEMNEE